MIEVFLCCSPADRDIASAIVSRLEQNAEASVMLDDGATESVAAKWEGGVSSTAILMLLSPDAVPASSSRTVWQGVLDHITANAEPPLGSLLVRDCKFPPLLQRKNFFRCDSGPRDTLRAIEEWVMRLHQLPQQRSFVPAHLPCFTGRQAELDLLWQTLVDRSGTSVILNGAPGSGKTSLAQEFARQANTHFRDVVWIACANCSPAFIAAELAAHLGIQRSESDPGELKHRMLLVLDDFPSTLTPPSNAGGRASILITSQSTDLRVPAAQVIQIGHTPETPLRAPHNPLDLQLWRAMAVCHPGGFPVQLAAQIAAIEPAALQPACERLIQARLADPFDYANRSLRLSRSSIAAAGPSLDPERRLHAEAVRTTLSQWATNPAQCKRYVAEISPAFQWAVAADWPLARELARHAFAFFKNQERMPEGAELLTALRDAADRRGEWEVSDNCAYELSWIRGKPYRGPDRAPIGGDQLSFDFAC